MKLIKMIKNFFPTLKKYIDYLMKVGYKELFVNTVLLFCLLLLAAFVYVPIGVLEDLINSTIQLFTSISGTVGAIYTYIFTIIKALCAIIAFIYLFNLRFEKIENEELNNESTKSNTSKVKKQKEDDLDLPKEKTE